VLKSLCEWYIQSPVIIRPVGLQCNMHVYIKQLSSRYTTYCTFLPRSSARLSRSQCHNVVTFVTLKSNGRNNEKLKGCGIKIKTLFVYCWSGMGN
jgi:hypothetical protein